MSVLGTIYTGLSGMLGFSKGLDVISDNVANMNTPGFKGSDVQFQDLFYKHQLKSVGDNSLSTSQVGHGVEVSSTKLRLGQGEIRATGNDTDAAIDGNGYFILRDGRDVFYTRAGQFDIDSEGYLVSQANGARVAGITNGNAVRDINVSDMRVSAPQSSSEITFSNNLSTGSSSHELTDIEIFDSAGTQHTLAITFTNNNSETPRSWLVEITDNNDNVVGSGEIRFQGNGSPEEGYSTIDFSFAPEDSDEVFLSLNFGEPGSFTGATSFSGGSNSTLSVDEIDGYGIGALSNIAFSESGEISLTYSNEQEGSAGFLALAHFENQQALQRLGDGMFRSTVDQAITIGRPSDSVFGSIVGGSIELSNVELTQQFTDLVIVQRGFQASSQVLTVANEMAQQLLNNTQGKT